MLIWKINMNSQVFTIRDSKANAYLQPFFMPNEAVATRAMDNCLRDKGHAFYANPEDFALYILGDYDDETGKFVLLDSPQHLFNLVDLSNNSDHELGE